MRAKPGDYPGFTFGDRVIESRHEDIAQTGAAVIVNSVGSRASFRNPIARSIAAAAGEEVKEVVWRYRLIEPGSVVVTHAGELKATRYVFHAVVTSRDTRYRTDPKLIEPVTIRCIRLADLLNQPTIAIPPFGTGMGRGNRVQILRQMVNAIIDILPDCRALKKVIFATTKESDFKFFNNLALTYVVLARREQELKDALRDVPPSLYGRVGDLLLQLEAARQAGDDPQELLQEAEGLVRVARELGESLPSQGEPADTVQLIIATGGSIIQNVTQQV